MSCLPPSPRRRAAMEARRSALSTVSPRVWPSCGHRCMGLLRLVAAACDALVRAAPTGQRRSAGSGLDGQVISECRDAAAGGAAAGLKLVSGPVSDTLRPRGGSFLGRSRAPSVPATGRPALFAGERPSARPGLLVRPSTSRRRRRCGPGTLSGPRRWAFVYGGAGPRLALIHTAGSGRPPAAKPSATNSRMSGHVLRRRAAEAHRLEINQNVSSRTETADRDRRIRPTPVKPRRAPPHRSQPPGSAQPAAIIDAPRTPAPTSAKLAPPRLLRSLRTPVRRCTMSTHDREQGDIDRKGELDDSRQRPPQGGGQRDQRPPLPAGAPPAAIATRSEWRRGLCFRDRESLRSRGPGPREETTAAHA